MVRSKEKISESFIRFKVSILSEAEADIDEAFIWYELKQINLGTRFFKEVVESVQAISNNPSGCRDIYKGIRRYIIRKFPYGIYYKVNYESKEIQIIGVIHFRRSRRIIKKRF